MEQERQQKDYQQYANIVKSFNETETGLDENSKIFHELRNGTITLLQNNRYVVTCIDTKKRLYKVTQSYFCETCRNWDHISYNKHKCYNVEYF